MAAVLDFPDRPCEDPRRVASRQTGCGQEGACEVVIFPGVRREHHAREPVRSGPKDGMN